MSATSRLASVLVTLAAAACASSQAQGPSAPGTGAVSGPETAAPVIPPTDPPAASAERAVFSEAQADRGRDTFRAGCTACHNSNEFSDRQFKLRWSRGSAGDLYEFIVTSMPEDAPGSLSAEESIDIVAYILRMNGFEAGASDLGPVQAELDQISLAQIRGS